MFLWATVGSPSASSDPLDRIQAADRLLHRLLQRRLPSWSPERDAQTAQVKAVLDGLLDYQEIAHRSLGGHWQTLTASQRARFVALLSALSESVYIERLAGTIQSPMVAVSESGNDDEREVRATREGAGGARYESVYSFVREGDRWMVCDVSQGGVDLVVAYREQFGEIIARESVEGLLARLQGKLREEEIRHGGS
jgi:ABC-type transporter MlaC component